LCWGHSGVVEMAMKDGVGESGHGEPLPQHEVVGVEANRDAGRCGDANRGSVGDRDDRP
jgi:hypothetical protein